MDRLEVIIEEGTKLNDRTIVPTVNERLSLKVSILNILSKLDSSIFVMNRQLYNWKQRLVSGEITLPDSVDELNKGEFSEKLSDWLLDPISVYCENPEEVAKQISNGLFEKGYGYVRARNDMYPSRIIVDVEFEIGAILNQTNKNLSKHASNVELYGVNINLNGALMLPIFLYDYITPKFNYEEWKNDLELEPFLWSDMQQKWVKKGVVKPVFNNLGISAKIFNCIKTENEGSYLFTGMFSYFVMTNQSGTYQGDYHIYHENPIEFMKKLNQEISGLKIREEDPMYYFQKSYYQLTFNGELVITIYPLEFQMSYIRIGFYNHANYHGLLLFLLLDAFKATLKEYDEKVLGIGYLIKYRNEYLKKNSGKNIFEILQNNSIGPRTNPFLEFKKREWNKELTFFYRPDKVEDKVDSDENEEDKKTDK